MALEPTNNFKRERYQQLLDAGFPKEWVDELKQHRPALYDNPKAKIEGLQQRGFDNPHKLITSSPAILGLAFENIDAKIDGLRSRGFDNAKERGASYAELGRLAFLPDRVRGYDLASRQRLSLQFIPGALGA